MVMEAKINIAAILKDKPKGTKLYSYICAGECILNEVSENAIYVDMYNKERFWYFSVYGTIYAFPNGGVLLYPSYKMRGWRKFAWKKGDVLVGNNGKREVLFSTWVNDSYTKFVGLHCLITNDNEEVEYDNGTTVFNTDDFKCVETEDAVQTYIKTIEEKLGGKLNRETLEIEPTQSEFKDGDILYGEKEEGIVPVIFILKISKEGRLYYACRTLGNYMLCDYKGLGHISNKKLRLATDKEKQQLFDALAINNKAWDAEKKMIVDLMPKVELKPFDKVLVRNTDTEEWFPGFFEKFDSTWNNPYHIMNRRSMTDFAFKQCIPYEGNESLLGTTKDVED